MSARFVALTMGLVMLVGCASDPTVATNLVWDRETQARIITSQGSPSRCIAPVRVFEVNGQTTPVNDQFYLAPGPALLKAAARPNVTTCTLVTIPPNLSLPACRMAQRGPQADGSTCTATMSPSR